jgi:hypothetical protein
MILHGDKNSDDKIELVFVRPQWRDDTDVPRIVH